MGTGASPGEGEMVRTSVVVQSREGDCGVRGPGMKVLSSSEYVPGSTRAHIWVARVTATTT